VAALALVVSACGSSDKGLLKGNQAVSLNEFVDNAEQAVSNGRCGNAAREAQAGADRVQQMENLDPKLQRNLIDGFNHLADEAATGCESDKPEKTPTPTPTEEPTETPTEEPTEAPTEAPTEVPTEVPTDVPTEVPTEVPTTSGGVESPLEGNG
jgi:outer membrane biosynthesis protein TonB